MRTETEIMFLQQNSNVIDVSESTMVTSFALPNRFVSRSHLLSQGLMEETTTSQPANIQLLKINRASLIRSIRGKYSFVQTSSDEFAKRKQTDINLEG